MPETIVPMRPLPIPPELIAGAGVGAAAGVGAGGRLAGAAGAADERVGLPLDPELDLPPPKI